MSHRFSSLRPRLTATLAISVVVTLAHAIGIAAATGGDLPTGVPQDGPVVVTPVTPAPGSMHSRGSRAHDLAPPAAPTYIYVQMSFPSRAHVQWGGMGPGVSSTVVVTNGGVVSSDCYRSIDPLARVWSANCDFQLLGSPNPYIFTAFAGNDAGWGGSISSSPMWPRSDDALPSLTAQVLPSRTHLVSGQSMRIGVRVTNTGSATASSVTSCLSLDRGLAVVTKGSTLRSGRKVCFRQGDLAPGGLVTSQLTGRATARRTEGRRISGYARATGVAPMQTSTTTVTVRPVGCVPPRPCTAG